MDKPRTVMELISLTSNYLADRGCDNPRLDAELLLANVLQLDRVSLYLNFDRPLTTQEVDSYRQLVARRGQREPIAYILGVREFYSLRFKVTKDVLIPRPETELLVEKALELAKDFPHGCRILDVGTGSGIIPVCLGKHLGSAKITAVDISPKALAVAKENAEYHGVNGIRFIESDLFDNLPSEKYEIICSNPPYISQTDLLTLQPEVKQEPVTALAGGVDGLVIYRRLLANAREHLVDKGYLIIEIGWDQGDRLAVLGREFGYHLVARIQDYAQKERVMVFQWST